MFTAYTLSTLLALQLSAPSSAPVAPATGGSVHMVELDGDGRLDKLVATRGGRLQVSLNRGGGIFEPVGQRLSGGPVASILTSDLDGDDRVDLYLVSSGANRAWLGDGTGRFHEATEALGLADGAPGLSAERVDLDGIAPEELLLHNRGGDVIFWPRNGAFVRDADTPAVAVAGLASHRCVTAEQRRILNTMSLVELPVDDSGTTATAIRIAGVNVQIVNGLGATNGDPNDPLNMGSPNAAVNAVGNLILGYNELRSTGNDRGGSHTLVLGQQNNYSSFGAQVASTLNTSQGPYASVLGGRGNLAVGWFASILGGSSGYAPGNYSAVVGGKANYAWSDYSAILGGRGNSCSGLYASVSGGENNQADGLWTSVTGGFRNRAVGDHATVSGGLGRQANSTNNWVAGSLFESF